MSNFCQNQMSKLYDLLDHNLVLGRGSVMCPHLGKLLMLSNQSLYPQPVTWQQYFGENFSIRDSSWIAAGSSRWPRCSYLSGWYLLVLALTSLEAGGYSGGRGCRILELSSLPS